MSEVLQGQFALIPVHQYQQVVISSKKRQYFKHYAHPDLDEETRALPDEDKFYAKDCLWEAILMLPDTNMDGITLDDRTQEYHKKVFEELAKYRTGSHELTPPFLANAAGFQFEYVNSAERFLASPRGQINITVPSGSRIFSRTEHSRSESEEPF